MENNKTSEFKFIEYFNLQEKIAQIRAYRRQYQKFEAQKVEYSALFDDDMKKWQKIYNITNKGKFPLGIAKEDFGTTGISCFNKLMVIYRVVGLGSGVKEFECNCPIKNDCEGCMYQQDRQEYFAAHKKLLDFEKSFNETKTQTDEMRLSTFGPKLVGLVLKLEVWQSDLKARKEIHR